MSDHTRYFLGGLVIGALGANFAWFAAMLFVVGRRRR